MSPDGTSGIATVDPRGSILKQGATEGDPDAMLVALGRRFEALSAEIAALRREEIDTLSPVVPRDEQSKGEAMIGADERIEAVLALLDPIERAIMATPAMTIVGLGVKASHAAQVLSYYWTDSPERLDWDARAVRFLIESMCAVAGVDIIKAVRFEAQIDQGPNSVCA